ncbi:MAG: hypothetical protein KME35_07730 [Aphanocapsa sp. GSE-SYN-MK-11-07L]|nr:hypothetical protein [Aphanocapsa sp. GSE-SYN-MK-11-07L]
MQQFFQTWLSEVDNLTLQKPVTVRNFTLNLQLTQIQNTVLKVRREGNPLMMLVAALLPPLTIRSDQEPIPRMLRGARRGIPCARIVFYEIDL